VSQLRTAIDASDQDAFRDWLQREPWLLAESSVPLQVELLEHATYSDREPFIRLWLDAEPALLQRRPPPPSAAIEYAFEYGHAAFVTLLARVWPLPDDLPRAAGSGDLERVERWFDPDGRPKLGPFGANDAAMASFLAEAESKFR
jgi:hypothetical protein